MIKSDDLIEFEAGVKIDGDGAPNCYHPDGVSGLDFTKNAGRPGNWWGIVCLPNGEPYTQREGDPFPGFYLSTTSYQRHKNNKNVEISVYSADRYLDARVIPFIVVPKSLARSVKPIVLGCKAEVYDPIDEKWINAMVGDFGPDVGEVSIAVAKALHFSVKGCSPKTGGTDTKYKYRIYPGIPAFINGEQFELQHI